MNWLHIIVEGVWIYGALFAVALVITYHTHLASEADGSKSAATRFGEIR